MFWDDLLHFSAKKEKNECRRQHSQKTGAYTYMVYAPLLIHLTYTKPLTSSQEPPFTTSSIPCSFRNIAPCPLRFPEAQHKIMGFYMALISSILEGKSCNGIFNEPTTCAPSNSQGFRTSIMVDVSILPVISLFFTKVASLIANDSYNCYTTTGF